jgi:hypothetical protein
MFLLEQKLVLGHPIITGELALGAMRDRWTILDALTGLPQNNAAEHEEARQFIDVHAFYGMGIGFSNSHLLASAKLTPNAKIWTRDKRLFAQAKQP